MVFRIVWCVFRLALITTSDSLQKQDTCFTSSVAPATTDARAIAMLRCASTRSKIAKRPSLSTTFVVTPCLTTARRSSSHRDRVTVFTMRRRKVNERRRQWQPMGCMSIACRLKSGTRSSTRFGDAIAIGSTCRTCTVSIGSRCASSTSRCWSMCSTARISTTWSARWFLSWRCSTLTSMAVISRFRRGRGLDCRGRVLSLTRRPDVIAFRRSSRAITRKISIARRSPKLGWMRASVITCSRSTAKSWKRMTIRINCSETEPTIRSSLR